MSCDSGTCRKWQVVLIDVGEKLLPCLPLRQGSLRVWTHAASHQQRVRPACIVVTQLHQFRLFRPGKKNEHRGNLQTRGLDHCRCHGRRTQRGPPGDARDPDDIAPRLTLRYGPSSRETAIDTVPTSNGRGRPKERHNAHGRHPHVHERVKVRRDWRALVTRGEAPGDANVTPVLSCQFGAVSVGNSRSLEEFPHVSLHNIYLVKVHSLLHNPLLHVQANKQYLVQVKAHSQCEYCGAATTNAR
mmetsp:Transcript_44310/g.117525  ORF Transcript_44310/g.117525 Transcript_44310/m.117525 type:complete len:244 (+) Transcript_44310:241-972(+)